MFSFKTVWFPFSSKPNDIESKPKNQVFQEVIDDKVYCLVWKDDVLIAFPEKCPHQKASLKDARCDGETIICPWHHYKFSLENGRDLTSHGNALRLYPVKKENGKYFLGIQKFSLF